MATDWTPSTFGHVRAAAIAGRRASAVAKFGAVPATPTLPADLPYQRQACPACGSLSEDAALLDVRELSDAQRGEFGIHPGADFVCTHVCLNDALNAGASLAQLYAALGAPNPAVQRATAFDDANPAHVRGESQVHLLPRRRLAAGDLVLD